VAGEKGNKAAAAAGELERSRKLGHEDKDQTMDAMAMHGALASVCSW